MSLYVSQLVHTGKSVAQSVNQSVSHSVCMSDSQLASFSVGPKSVSQKVSCKVCQFVSQ